MFCTNCGRDIAEGVKFCPVCGTPVEGADVKSQRAYDEAEPKITVSGDFDKLRQKAEENATRSIIFKVVVGVVLAFGIFLAIRGAVEDIGKWMDGEIVGLYIFLNISIAAFLTSVILYIIYRIATPYWEKKKALSAQEYLSYIHVSDIMSLKEAAERMKCATVKSVYLDEDNNLCIQAKRYKHVLNIEDGIMTISSSKDNYKASLEQESIALNLLKYLSPQAPVNAFESEKRNLRILLSKKIVTAAFVVCFVICFISYIAFEMSGGNDKYISIVKETAPQAYPDITYGEAMDSFLEDCRWKQFKSEDGQNVVELNGKCIYDGNEAEAAMQFIVSVDDSGEYYEIELYTMSLDGEVQPKLVQGLFLIKVFESYENGNGKDADGEAKAVQGNEETEIVQNEKEDTASTDMWEDENEPEFQQEEPEDDVENDIEDEVEDEAEDDFNPLYDTDLRFPVLTQDLSFDECPVLVSVEMNPVNGGGIVPAKDYDDMLTYCVDDGITMYAPPKMKNGMIYTDTSWLNSLDDLYHKPLSRKNFLNMVGTIAKLYSEGVSEFDSTILWDDVHLLSGRWASGDEEISMSIYSEFSSASCSVEIGKWYIGDIQGYIYVLGKADGEVWLLCENDDEILQFFYQLDGTLLRLDDGMVFQCIERFES